MNNNQRYFTYNQNDGLPENNYFVIDPVIAIVNSSMDSDYLGSEMTFTQFVIGKSKKQAMEHIEKDVRKTKTEDCIHSLVSVYGKLGQEIHSIKFYVQLYGLSMAGVLLLLILLVLFRVSSYYRIYYQKVTVYILHGQSKIRILRLSILLQTVVVMIASLVIAVITNFLWVVAAGGVLAVFMALVMILYGSYLARKNISGLKRGEK